MVQFFGFFITIAFAFLRVFIPKACKWAIFVFLIFCGGTGLAIVFFILCSLYDNYSWVMFVRPIEDELITYNPAYKRKCPRLFEKVTLPNGGTSWSVNWK